MWLAYKARSAVAREPRGEGRELHGTRGKPSVPLLHWMPLPKFTSPSSCSWEDRPLPGHALVVRPHTTTTTYPSTPCSHALGVCSGCGRGPCHVQCQERVVPTMGMRSRSTGMPMRWHTAAWTVHSEMGMPKPLKPSSSCRRELRAL